MAKDGLQHVQEHQMNVDTLIRRSPKAKPMFGGFRRFNRHDLKTSVVVQDEEGWEIPLDSVNLSPTGMFVESDFLFEVGDRHILIFEAPDNGAWIRVEAKVIRVDSGEVDTRVSPPEAMPSGMAYEFEAIEDASWSELCRILEA
jgi:hypothetical protein